MTTRVTIGTKRSGRTAWLEPGAAAAYQRMLAAGMPAGCITDAGRTYEEQEALWRAYLRGELVAYAAYPGTSSHETGRALDLAEPARSWVRSHGADFGWMKDRVRREPWHMEYEVVADKQLFAPKPAPEAIDPIIEEYVMRETFIGVAPDSKHYLINLTEGTFQHILDEAELRALGKRYGNDPELIVPLSQDGLNALATFAARVRRTNAEAAADAIWSRPVTVKGERMTAGAAVQLIANEVAG